MKVPGEERMSNGGMYGSVQSLHEGNDSISNVLKRDDGITRSFSSGALSQEEKENKRRRGARGSPSYSPDESLLFGVSFQPGPSGIMAASTSPTSSFGPQFPPQLGPPVGIAFARAIAHKCCPSILTRFTREARWV
ncbi:unnamed protein product, partial [Darwinula stevensoni]